VDPADRRVYDQTVARVRARFAADSTASNETIRRFLDIAGRRFLDQGIDAQTLMREAGIKRNVLHHSFHRFLGTTPWRYILDRRFEVATELLAETWIEIWKVGFLVGFASPRTVSRAFKREVGHTAGRQAQRRRARAKNPSTTRRKR
jgi:transcriptional regulator GlxA family with amidase domain